MYCTNIRTHSIDTLHAIGCGRDTIFGPLTPFVATAAAGVYHRLKTNPDSDSIRRFSPLLPHARLHGAEAHRLPVSDDAWQALYLAWQSTRVFLGITSDATRLYAEDNTVEANRTFDDRCPVARLPAVSAACCISARIHQRAMSFPPIPYDDAQNSQDAEALFEIISDVRADQGRLHPVRFLYLWILLTGLASSRGHRAKALFYGECIRNIFLGPFESNGEMGLMLYYFACIQKRHRVPCWSADLASLQAMEINIMEKWSTMRKAPESVFLPGTHCTQSLDTDCHSDRDTLNSFIQHLANLSLNDDSPAHYHPT